MCKTAPPQLVPILPITGGPNPPETSIYVQLHTFELWQGTALNCGGLNACFKSSHRHWQPFVELFLRTGCARWSPPAYNVVSNLIDIHSHIIPGVDDGPATLQEAVAMLHIAARSGTTDIVATPHCDFRFAFDPDGIEDRLAELREAAGGIVRIQRGCEFHLSPENLECALAHPSRYTINQKSHLLVELPDALVPRSIPEIFDALRAVGLTPVVAHPERHYHLQLEQLRWWVEGGSLVQVTAQALVGGFGRQAAASARRLMRAGLVHFVASDAHDAKRRTPALDDAYAYVARHFGKCCARTLFVDNPQAALEGQPVDTNAVGPRPRRWWFL